VHNSQGIARSRSLALHHSQQAIASLYGLPDSAVKESLLSLAEYVLSRMN
jgi:all-trans-nonaprenyl-diphosphate synthase